MWHFRSFKRKQRRMRQWHTDPDFPETVLIRSTRELESWLASLGARQT